jgi:pimeloyl-ACP methyl ester carboxylesterase
MRRGGKLLLGLLVVLAALLAVNTVVLDSQTKRAELTVDGAEIVELSAVDLQVLDEPADIGGSGEAEGAPIVLLHCYGCSMRWWDQLAPLLTSRHRVIRIDLIGHGGSEKPKGDYAITEQAAAVGEALNGMGVEGATVVGHSLGGVVATALAEQSSELVDRVVIIDSPSEAGSSELPLESRISRIPVIGEALWRLRVDSLVKSGYESAFAEDFDFEAAFEDPDQVVVDNEAMTYTSYDNSIEASNDYLEERGLPSRLTGAAVPVLGIFGSEDQLLDGEAVAADFEAVPGAVVQVMDGIGHSPNLEAPADTAELVLRFAGAAPVTPPEPEPKPQPKPEPKPKPKKEPEGKAGKPKDAGKRQTGADEKRPAGDKKG